MMSVVERCCGERRAHLSPDQCQALRALLRAPTPEAWALCRTMVVRTLPRVTLATAVELVTRGRLTPAPIPDPFTLYRALRFVLD